MRSGAGLCARFGASCVPPYVRLVMKSVFWVALEASV